MICLVELFQNMGDNKLIEKVEQLMNVKDLDFKKIHNLSSEYLELLSISNSNEIKEMLHQICNKYYFDVPVWIKLIAIRLALLLDPNDSDFKIWAEGQITPFIDPYFEEQMGAFFK